MSGALLAGPVILAAQLVAMYLLGSYAMSALGSAAAAGGKGFLRKLAFYLLVAPGVIAHESAHYLAAKLTGTPVGRFVPFAPRTDPSGRVTLGYVTHAARGPLTAVVIGMAPVIANPLVLVLVTNFMTPVNPVPEAAMVSDGAGVLRAVAGLGESVGSFAGSDPAMFALWAYLSLSLSVGSVPSREDFAAVPAALILVCIGGFAYGSVFGTGFLWSLSQAAVYGISLYLLPLVVAGVAAVAGLIAHT